MTNNHLKIAFRNLVRQKGSTAINILGLTVGLVCSTLIGLWVWNEIQIDQFHEKGDRIYIAMQKQAYSDGKIDVAPVMPYPSAAAMLEHYPEVEQTVLIADWNFEFLFTLDGKSQKERGHYVGPDFFRVFSYPMLVGDAATALIEPHSIVLSTQLAEKYFGENWETEALGKTIRIEAQQDYKVTGVFDAESHRSSMQLGCLLPIQDFVDQNAWLNDWRASSLELYVALKPDVQVEQLATKVKDLRRKYQQEAKADIMLYPFKDYYLRSTFEDGIQAGGQIEYVRVFSAVAIFLLLIACINFMNLATAKSLRRAKEVGVRKTIGARRGTLVRQFLTEAFLLAGISLIMATILVEVLLPVFNSLTGKELATNYLHPAFWLVWLTLLLATTLLAGGYPAFFLSSFKISESVKGTMKFAGSTLFLRKGLVVFQFALSVLLIASTIIVHNQIQYIKNKNLGLNRENVVHLELEGSMSANYQNLKTKLLQQPEIKSVSATDNDPLLVQSWTSNVNWPAKDPEERIQFVVLGATYGFDETLEMKLLQGRSFSEEFPADSSSYILNETAARAMGLEEPVGQTINLWNTEGRVVGVVQDFHAGSMHKTIDPMIIRFNPQNSRQLLVRLEAGQTAAGLAKLEEMYNSYQSEYPFAYKFMDSNFEALYQSEMLAGKLSNLFAIIAIFISCLGLIGLSALAAEQRTKEIGVRKVLGATTQNLVLLLSKDFVKLALIAIVIAVPVTIYFMQQWLQQFAYSTQLSWWVFAVAGLLTIGIAWLAVSFQSVKAALANPVESLKSE